MVVEHDIRNNIYFVKEKIHEQTMVLKFEEFDRNLNTIYYNVYLSVYTKRKNTDYNENNCLVTGKYPFETVSKVIRAFNEIEKEIIESKSDFKKYIYVGYVDNKRRNAYFRYLSKKGYQYGFYDNKKCIYKIY